MKGHLGKMFLNVEQHIHTRTHTHHTLIISKISQRPRLLSSVLWTYFVWRQCILTQDGLESSDNPLAWHLFPLHYLLTSAVPLSIYLLSISAFEINIQLGIKCPSQSIPKTGALNCGSREAVRGSGRYSVRVEILTANVQKKGGGLILLNQGPPDSFSQETGKQQ